MTASVSRQPLFDDLDEVVGAPAAPKHVDPDIIKTVSETQNFPNRDVRRGKADSPAAGAAQPAPPAPTTGATPERTPAPAEPPAAQKPLAVINHQPRRFRTGRNIPVNIKLDETTRQTLYAVAEELDAPLGEVIERALAALREKLAPA